MVVSRFVIRLGSRGIGDSGSRKVLLGFIEKNGEGSRKLGWGGKDTDLGNITEGVRAVGVSVDKHSEGGGQVQPIVRSLSLV